MSSGNIYSFSKHLCELQALELHLTQGTDYLQEDTLLMTQDALTQSRSAQVAYQLTELKQTHQVLEQRHGNSEQRLAECRRAWPWSRVSGACWRNASPRLKLD